MTPTLDIYKASAGSGKTFLLTVKYLLLLFRRPNSYRQILAVTFTNKATAEMKGRILDVLKWLATENEKGNPYKQQLLDALQDVDEINLQQLADLLYRTILHDYSRFSVSTIDAFVQRIIRSFAWEIGIDSGFQLQMDTAPVKEDLAERMYHRLDDDTQLREWVVGLASERLAEGKAWNFREDMTRLAEELFKERFAGFEDGLRTIGDDAAVNAAFGNLMKKLVIFTKQFEDEWMAVGQQVVNWMETNGLDFNDFPYGKSGFISYFHKVAAGETAAPGKRFNDAIANPSKMANTKASAGAKAIIAGFSEQLVEISNVLSELRAEKFPTYAAALAIRKNLGILRIMRVFYEELKNYRKENNKLLMSDTHLLLRQLTRDTEASFIYEKTGNRYRHFLIDEFQDTSGFQWENFRPLIENAMSEGAYNLIVGDVKQAIYRWRNGDWRLLLSEVQRQLGSLNIAEHTLQDNRRSARQVIEFNNYLFFAAPRLLQMQMDDEMLKAPSQTQERLRTNGYNRIFNDAYADAIQQAPEKVQENGFIQLQFIPDKDENNEPIDCEAIVPEQLHAAICDLLSEGFVASDIAILVRTNGEAAAIVNYLLEAQQQPGSLKYDLLSGDALLLAKFPAIQLLICAMRVLSDIRDKVALAQLKYLHQLQQGNTEMAPEVFASNGGFTGLPTAFVQQRQAFRSLPVAELVHQLIALFQLNLVTENGAYLVAFQDLIFQWGRYGEMGLAAFLKYWDEEGIKKSLPGGANAQAVEVITIHKSKGLAYTILLMPYLDWKLVHDAMKAPQLWVDTSSTPFNDIPVVPVRYRSALAESVFAYDYFEEQVLCVMDNLNVLYVAFTRARQRIYGWAPKEKIGDSGINTMGKLLQVVAAGQYSFQTAGLFDTREGYDATTIQWTYGNKIPPVVSAPKMGNNLMPPLHYHLWQQGLQVRYRALETAEDTASRLPREQGVLLHEVLARLLQPDELVSVLHQMQWQGLITQAVMEKMQATLQALLDLPVLQPWVTGQMQRLAERSLLTTNREIRRPDWVLYNDTKTSVIDFKFTDDEKDKPKHQHQVLEYMQLLAQAGFSHVEGFVVYGNSLQVVPVLENK